MTATHAAKGLQFEYSEATLALIEGIDALDEKKGDPEDTAVQLAAVQAGPRFYNERDNTGLLVSMVNDRKAHIEREILDAYGLTWAQLDRMELRRQLKEIIISDLKALDDAHEWDFPRMTEEQEDVIWYEWFAGQALDAIFHLDANL